MRAFPLAAAILLGAAASSHALDPGAVFFSNTYALSAFDGLSGFLVGSNGFRIGGAGEGDQFGSAVDTAGDVNGDGRSDLLVGAPTLDLGPTFRAGRAYVLYGGPTLAPDQSVALLTNALAIDGSAADDQAGAALAGGGDFNGDGFADILVAAPYHDGAATNAGLVGVVFGGTNLPANLALSALDGANGFRLTGETNAWQAGEAVAFAGDVNGDGRDDVLVGAPAASTPGTASVGRAYIVFGATQPPATLALGSLNGTNGCQLNGEGAGHRAGACVAALGDVDGDGRPDVFVGAPSAGASLEGRGYVIFGRTNWPAALPLAGLDGTNGFRVDGPASFFAALGVAATGADLNGDGLRDLVVGSRFLDRIFVLFGTTNRAAARSVSALDGSNGFTCTGPSGAYFGSALARGGRLNVDAFDDIVIGAREATVNGFSSAGYTYILCGQAGFAATTDVGALQGTNGFWLAGQQTDARSGYAVASAGDWDDDGLDDILVGEYQADYGSPAATNAGAVYLLSPLGAAQQVLYHPALNVISRDGDTNHLAWIGQPGVTYDVHTSASPNQAWGLAATVASGGTTTTWDHAGSTTSTVYRLHVRR